MYSQKCTEQNLGQTKMNTTTLTVPNFLSLLENKSCHELRTNKENGDAAPKFRLKILFLGHDNDVVEIYYLSAVPLILKEILTVCRLFEEHSLVIKELHTVPPNKWQYLAILFKRDIVSHKGNFLLDDGSLQLKFYFMITNDLNIVYVQSLVPEAQLSNDCENLLQNGLFADVIIKSAEEVEYKTHKAVLASRSAVLRALFEHNMTESLTNVVESPLESDILREVLTFIYSDKAPRVDEIPEKLLAAADYYQLTRLKCICEEALQKKLTVDNVISTLQLADLHSAPELKQMALEFIKDGHANLITQSEGWAKIKSVDLIKTIYQFIMSDDLDADIK